MSANDEMWRKMLEGTDPELVRLQRTFRRIPKAPVPDIDRTLVLPPDREPAREEEREPAGVL